MSKKKVYVFLEDEEWTKVKNMKDSFGIPIKISKYCRDAIKEKLARQEAERIAKEQP